MKILSSDFNNNRYIPVKFSCEGEEINPNLEISEVPERAGSLALIVDDPDAPGGGWVHWLLWNIDVEHSIIRENSVPEEAVEGVTSSGKPGYNGPCPPRGTHRYFFTLYALDNLLDLPASAGKKELLEAMDGHIIAQAELVGLYQMSHQ